MEDKELKTWMDLSTEELEELLNVAACMYSARKDDALMT